jgi:hypothetical protein
MDTDKHGWKERNEHPNSGLALFSIDPRNFSGRGTSPKLFLEV